MRQAAIRNGEGWARDVCPRLLWLSLGVGLVPPFPALAQEPPAVPSTPWIGEDGAPLPFQDETEILSFLSTASVVARDVIPQGVNKPLRVVLYKDGVRARAAFRWVDFERTDAEIGDRFFLRFKDSCHNECAAYALSQAMGLDFVPPTVPRRLDGRQGSLQLWVEGGEDVVGFKPTNVAAWVHQVWDRDLFDSLIYNVDRNSGNMIVGPDERLWLIDHTRAFQPVPELLEPELLKRVNREAWVRLEHMAAEELTRVGKGALDAEQLRALARRRGLLLAHVKRLIDERGSGAVFY